MEGDIERTTATLIESLGRGDASTAARTYGEDAKVLAATGELIQGRAEIEAYWRAGIAVGLSAVDFERRVLAAFAGSVVEAGRYALSVGAGRPGTAVDRGTYLVLHRQAPGGIWRRSLDVFNSDETTASRHDRAKEEQR